MSSDAGKSKIKQFYSKTNILITGGTGFFGKILTQKLLRSCDDINGIYLIVRPKKGVGAKERLEETFSDVIFDTLKQKKPDFLNYVHLIEGDCSTVKLGMSEQNIQLLKDKINIVFHCAASMSMGAKLRDAIDTNIQGISELLDISQEMTKLKSFVYVSTVYCCYPQYVIEERLYETPVQANTLMKLRREVDEKALEDVTPGLLQAWPNTYCFTKAVAEDMLRHKGGNLPVGVFRPSVVMPTNFDPIPGWTSNIWGAVGIMLASGLGILRVMRGNKKIRIDFVPVDLCVNSLICAAWEISQKRQLSPSEIPVYNYAETLQRNMTLEKFVNHTLQYKYPFKEPLWATMFITVNNKWCHDVLWFLLHTIPAYSMDAYLFVTGKKTRMVKVYEKIGNVCEQFYKFTTKEWDIINKNVEKLQQNLEEVDRKLFPFDMDLVNQSSFYLNVCTGIKVYLLKESLDNTEAEMRNYQRLVKMHKAVKYLLICIAFGVFYFLLRLFNLV